MRVTAVSAERLVILAHSDAESRGNRFLAKRKMARALDHILQKEIEGAFLTIAYFHL
jgi:hypothetical protein